MSKYISNDKASLTHIPTVHVGVLMNCPSFYNTCLQVWYHDSMWLQGESVVSMKWYDLLKFGKETALCLEVI